MKRKYTKKSRKHFRKKSRKYFRKKSRKIKGGGWFNKKKPSTSRTDILREIERKKENI